MCNEWSEGLTPEISARLSVRIPPELHRRLRVAAAVNDTTIQALVIQALDEWLGDVSGRPVSLS